MQTGGNIRDHIRIHTNDKPFACATCGKTFKTQNNLKGHEVIHSDERPHVCDICGLAFKQKGLLKVHRRRHDTDAPPFTCQICGRGFYSSTEVKKHIPVHTGERKYECEVCGKRFRQDSALIRHRTTHMADKPFHCDVCNKSFGRKHQLKQHIMKYHTNENAQITNIDSINYPSNEVYVRTEEGEDAHAAEQLLERDTLYVQLTQLDENLEWQPGTHGDRDASIVYQSLEIPTQHGQEIIIEVTGDTQQHYTYAHT